MSDNSYRMTFPLYASTALLAANVTETWDQVVSLPNGDDAVLATARFMPATSVTANDTSYVDLSIEINTTEVASEQTTTGDTGSLTAGTELSLSLSGNLEVSDGDRITVKKTHASSGVILDGTLTLDFTRFRAA